MNIYIDTIFKTISFAMKDNKRQLNILIDSLNFYLNMFRLSHWSLFHQNISDRCLDERLVEVKDLVTFLVS